MNPSACSSLTVFWSSEFAAFILDLIRDNLHYGQSSSLVLLPSFISGNRHVRNKIDFRYHSHSLCMCVYCCCVFVLHTIFTLQSFWPPTEFILWLVSFWVFIYRDSCFFFYLHTCGSVYMKSVVFPISLSLLYRYHRI